MRRFFSFILVMATCLIFSCNGNGKGNKKNTDSAYSGLEGTREEDSRLSDAPIDTSSGQTAKKSPKGKDSLSTHTDSLPVK